MFCGDAARPFATVPGIDPINAMALVAAVGNASTFVHESTRNRGAAQAAAANEAG
jgi:hypothetical protein